MIDRTARTYRVAAAVGLLLLIQSPGAFLQAEDELAADAATGPAHSASGTLDGVLDRMASKHGAMGLVESAAERLTNGRPSGGNDDGFTQGYLL